MNEILRVENTYKQYGDKVILDNVDLSVRKGEFCTLVGPSGCGKSTLLRLILGQEQATAGKITINDESVGFPDTKRGIVFQGYSLFPHLTVLENILLGKKIVNKPWWSQFQATSDEQDEAAFYLKKLRLSDSANKYPHELSGGMRQRVAIAQALIMKPPILLMDEPFGALDPDTREDIQLFLMELWEEENLTIFFVTHDLVEACFVGSRLLVLSQYYSDDRGDHNKHGAKILGDYPLANAATSTEVKDNPDFQALIRQVRCEGFNPAVRQHVEEFNLNHTDSFQTLTGEENVTK